MKTLFHRVWILFAVLITSPFIVLGQDLDICRTLIEETFDDLAINCAGIDIGEVCFAYGGLSSTFYVDNTPQVSLSDLELLSTPGEYTDLLTADRTITLESIRTSAFDPTLYTQNTDEDSEDKNPAWGIAVIFTPANLPQLTTAEMSELQTFSMTPTVSPESEDVDETPTPEILARDRQSFLLAEPRGAKIIVIGDTRIENAVFPEDAFVIGNLVELSVENTEVYNVPPNYRIESEVIATVDGTLFADAISPDQEWVRVFYLYDRDIGQRATAWLPLSSLPDMPDVNGLSILGEDDYTPMQRFYFDSAPDSPDCEVAVPPGLIVEGVEGVETEVVINNVPVRLTSAAHFQKISDVALRIVALDGIVILFPDTDHETILVPGFGVTIGLNTVEGAAEAVICLEGPGDYGIDGEENDFSVPENCEFPEPELLGNAELLRFNSLIELPDNIVGTFPFASIFFASGEGNAIRQLSLSSDRDIEELLQLCEDALLPSYICDVLPS